MIKFILRSLTYVKRVVMLPRHFAAHAQAAAEHRAAMQAFTCRQEQTSAEMQLHLLALTEQIKTLINVGLPVVVEEYYKRNVQGAVNELVTEVHTAVANMAAEQEELNDRHAVSYDRLIEQLRRQADALQSLASELSARQTRRAA